MLGTETVVARPGDRKDRDGERVPGVGVPMTLSGCVVEPLDSSESQVPGRSGTFTKIKIFGPGGSRPIVATDVVDARGQTWEIQGFPNQWIDDDPDLSGVDILAFRGIG